MYRELPLSHPNRLLMSNTNAVIYPQRRYTPPPPCLIWHDTSFVEENWSILADIVIRYFLRNSKDYRDARICIKDNGQGFWMQARACRISKPQSNWKWKEIAHTSLTPLTACYQNKDWLWVIISGTQDVGRYCKALNCPRLLENAESTDLWFTVALARLEMQNGWHVIIIDDLMQVWHIRQGDLGVVFQMLQERKNDPYIYKGTRGALGKRLRAQAARELRNTANVLDGEEATSTVKRRRIGDTEAGLEVEVAGQAGRDSENGENATGEAAPYSEKVFNSAVEGPRFEEVLSAGEWGLGIGEKQGIADTEAGDKVAHEAAANSESVADSYTEGSEMEAPYATEVDSENAAAD
jgi:hypothetical protein